MSARIVLAAGAFRSGSTWLYNAARRLLESTGARVAGAWVDDFAEPGPGAVEVAVVKLHEPSEAWAGRAWRILTSHRDPRDVAASAADFLQLTDDADLLRSVERAVGDHDFWAGRAHFDLRYEAMREDAAREIGRLALVLDLPPDPARDAALARELEAMPEPGAGSSYDATSLLHARHRFDGAPGAWARRLGPERARLVESRFGEWMARLGYGPDRG